MSSDTMKRAEITGKDLPLRVVSAQRYEPPPEGVLVRTTFAGLCHTDLHFLMGDDVLAKRLDILGDAYVGVTPGHEAAGVIESFGGKARPSDYDLSIGDRVCIYPWLGCQECDLCQAGDSNLCEQNRMATTEIGQGPNNPGGFASHVPVVHCKYVVKVPESIPMEIACMLPCSAITAYNALLKTRACMESALAVRGLAQLLVTGAGGVGLWAIQIAKYLYPDSKRVTIIAADIGEERLAVAKEYGVNATIQWGPEKPMADNIADTTSNGERKLDAVVDFVNNPMTAEIALGSLHHGGTLVMCGFFGGHLSLPLPMMVAKTFSIQGSRVAPIRLLRELVNIAAGCRFSYPSLEYYDLENVNIAVERMKKRQIKGRALFKFVD